MGIYQDTIGKLPNHIENILANYPMELGCQDLDELIPKLNEFYDDQP